MISRLLRFIGFKSKTDNDSDDLNYDDIIAAVEGFKNRPIYSKLTIEILKNTPDDQLGQTVFDNIYELIGEDYDNELQNIEKMSTGQQAIFSTWIAEIEINNGGFNQFFFNSSGQYVAMAADAYELIGAKKFGGLMKKAIELYSSLNENHELNIDGTLESFSESYTNNPFDDLDNKFYELYETGSLSEMKIVYIKNNIQEFIAEWINTFANMSYNPIAGILINECESIYVITTKNTIGYGM